MSTKQNPGPFDCYAKLAPDEPYFVLRAKDPIAPQLITVWKAIRSGDYAQADFHLKMAGRAMEAAVSVEGCSLLPADSDKAREAIKVATNMVLWRSDHSRT